MRLPGRGRSARVGHGSGGRPRTQGPLGWRLRASWAGGDTAFGCDAGSVRRGRGWWNGGGAVRVEGSLPPTLLAEDSQRWQRGGGGVMLLTERAHPGRGGSFRGV